MFNRICHTVSHTDGRCIPTGRRHRSPRFVQPAVVLRDRFARNSFAPAEAL